MSEKFRELFAAGASDQQAAEHFRMALMSANRWHRALDAGGMDALASKGPSGEKCKLTDAQLQALEAALQAGPAPQGWDEDQGMRPPKGRSCGLARRDPGGEGLGRRRAQGEIAGLIATKRRLRGVLHRHIDPEKYTVTCLTRTIKTFPCTLKGFTIFPERASS